MGEVRSEMGKPTAEQLAKINQLAKTPLTEDQVYVFNAKLIGDKPIPGRYMRVTPNFLRKMAEDAKAGVSLMLDHSWANIGILAMPYGRTFDAQLKQEPDGELALYADHYIVRGQTLNGVNTDDIIAAVDSGTLFDTSVGYNPTKSICSIDGLDYYGGKCMHYRGYSYDGEVCSVEQDDGSLMENSLVFDGAYPGAGVVAASQKHNHDHHKALVSIEDAGALKNADSVFCFYSQKTGLHEYVQQKPKGDESTLDNKQTPQHASNDQALQQAQAALSTANGLLGQIKTALGVSADGDIVAKITSLSAQAQVGEQYKSKVLDEALGAGVRAQGDSFNTDAMKAALSNLPVSEIEKVRDTYEAQAKTVLGNGGRQTQGADAELPSGAATGAAPTNPQANGGQPTPEQLQAKAKDEARAALARTGFSNVIKEAK